MNPTLRIYPESICSFLSVSPPPLAKPLLVSCLDYSSGFLLAFPLFLLLPPLQLFSSQKLE